MNFSKYNNNALSGVIFGSIYRFPESKSIYFCFAEYYVPILVRSIKVKIGYARVSTRDQNLDLQLSALKKAGCKKIYQETISGAKAERPVLIDLLNNLRKGDVLVIWKLDRLGRSLKNLIEIVSQLMGKKIGLQSLNDPVDTTTSHGRFIFNLFASLAEFERDIIRDRTQAGLSAARARGHQGGRPAGLSKQGESVACAAETLYLERKLSVRQIAHQLGIAKTTLYAYLRHRGVPIGHYEHQKKPKKRS
jgi:DNA invertase Pin-like site-specific DNA recombinase